MVSTLQGDILQDSIPSSTVLVVGDGLTASITVTAAKSLGLDVLKAEFGSKSSVLFNSCGNGDFSTELNIQEQPDPRSAQMRIAAPIRVFSTERGFTAIFKDGRRTEFGAVIIATEGKLKSAPKDLPEGVTVITPGFPGLTMGSCVCFLLDYGEMTDPSIGMSSIRAAIGNKQAGGNSYVLLRHAPVKGLLGETLYEEARLSGVRFLRYGDKLPRFEHLSNTDRSSVNFRVSIWDIVESGDEIVFDTDHVFVGVNLEPTDIPAGFKDLLSLEMDDRGFLIQNNVHCLTGKSFRRGAYCVGPSAGYVDLAETVLTAHAVAADAASWLSLNETPPCEEKMSVTEQCIRCMTCLRLCPYSAITINAEPSKSKIKVSQTRCLECGICVAECPRTALDLVGFSEQEFSSFVESLRANKSIDKVAVFGCHRSAGHAISEVNLPGNVFFPPVSCAGRLSESILSSTLTTGVKGILILGCHHGNCRSNNGTDLSKARIEAISNKLSKVFHKLPSISYKTMAANEASRMLKLVHDFSKAVVGNSE